MNIKITNSKLKIIALVIASFTVSSCNIPRASGPPVAADRTAPASIALPIGAEGSPLPPQNTQLEANWPPNIQKIVNGMLDFSKKKSLPAINETENAFGVSFVEQVVQPNESRTWIKKYDVIGDPTTGARNNPGFAQINSLYAISRLSNNKNLHNIQLITSPTQVGFCLDPYEFAVYSGMRFTNGGSIPDSKTRYWKPAYAWGMFTWSETGRYMGDGIMLIVSSDKTNPRKLCITTITAYSSF